MESASPVPGRRPAPGSRVPGPPPLVAALLYALAFAALTWPLLLSPVDAVVSHWDTDVEHSLWVQWWFARAVESPEHDLFRSPMVAFPQPADLRLADLNLAVNALSWVATPLLGLAGAYNALLLGSFLVSGLLTFRLAKRLGAHPAAAWLGGLFFAGAPCWIACMLNGWGYLVHTGVFPLVLLALHRVREDPGGARLLALALALAFAFHVTPYYFLYLLVLVPILVLAEAGVWWEALRRSRPRRWLLAFAAPLAIAIGPRALSMWRASRTSLVAHHGPQNTELSAGLLELVWPAPDAVAARVPEVGFLVVFLGYTLLATVAAGLCATRRRAAYAPWLVGAGATLLLALGPHPKWASGVVLDSVALPAAWLQRLPGFELTTNHWRWVVPSVFCLGVLLAHATTDLMARARARGREAWVPLLVLTGFAFEVAFVFPVPVRKPLWDARPSPIAAVLAERGDVHAVLDRSGRAKLNQTVHGLPIALGWLPRMAAETRRAQAGLVAACRGLDPTCLRRFGIDAVVLDDRRALLLEGAPEAPRVRLVRAGVD